MLDFTLPREAPWAKRPTVSTSAPTSVRSPTAVPVPWASIIVTVFGSTPAW